MPKNGAIHPWFMFVLVGLSMLFISPLAMLTQAQGNRLFADNGQELVAPQGNVSQAVALGDIDGDGDVDAVVAQGTYLQSQPNVIWLNDGQGQFTIGAQTLGDGGTDIALADLDGDGDLDVVIANNGFDQATRGPIWLNQGGLQGGQMGIFVNTLALDSTFSQQVVLGDLDGDSDLDILSLGEKQVWWNDGAGQLVAGPVLSDMAGGDVALGDLDNDQDLDIVSTSFSQFSPGQILWNDWADQNQFTPGPTLNQDTETVQIALADLDLDGYLDIFAATQGPNRIWWNDGDQTFSASPGLGDELDYDLALADVDADGDIDAFVARRITPTSTTGAPNGLWLNQGNRTFTLSQEEIGNNHSLAVALADLDGDSDLDAYVGNSGFNKVWLNQGGGSTGGPVQTGQFVDSGQALGRHLTTDVALADLDGDNDLDAFVANRINNPDQPADFPGAIWLNQAGLQGGTPGVFADSGQLADGINSRSVDLGDVDSDGDIDAFLIRDTGVEFWLNSGRAQAGTEGEFVLVQTLPITGALDLTLGDVDNDGDLDLYLMLAVDSPDQIFLNRGGQPPLFLDSGQRISSHPHPLPKRQVAFADIDNDADLDVVLVQGWLYIHLNEGGHQGGQLGIFSHTQSLPSFRNAFAMINLDDDGYPDLILADSPGISVRRNLGLVNGTYGHFEFHSHLTSQKATDLAVADLNGDNQPDVVGIGPTQNAVFLTNSTGQLIMSQQIGNPQSQAIATGDLDGDQDLDLFIANGGPNRVWLNGEAGSGLWPTISLAYNLARDGTRFRYDHLGNGNALFPFQLSGPATKPISLTARLIFGTGGELVDTFTIPAGETVGYPTIRANQPGGVAGTIWNPYQGTTQLGETVTYQVDTTINTPGVSLLGPSQFLLVFYEPQSEFISRDCALGLIGLLTVFATNRNSQVALPHNDDPLHLDLLRDVRDQIMVDTAPGRYYNHLYQAHSLEIGQIAAKQTWLMWQTVAALQAWAPAFQGLVDGQGSQHRITAGMVNGLTEILETYQANASPEFSDLIEREMTAVDLPSFVGLNMEEAWDKLNERVISEHYLPVVVRP